MCPVCALSIAAGLGISRWLNIDDSILGIWSGALILALSIWTLNLFFKSEEKKPFSALFFILSVYLFLTFIPLHQFGLIPDVCQKIFGLNRIYFGTGLGIILGFSSIYIDKKIRQINNNKAYFPYQKVIIPLLILTAASLMLYYIFCR
ncbi:MAG: hypothetical protein PHI53_01225 [Candidatus Pacebacteria bacterium]|nr:hypothetical protein [Candidatus Paceibacterota bacterium]